MSKFYLKTLDARVEILSQIVDKNIKIIVNEISNKKLHFACYFYLNNILVSRSKYTRTGVFNFSMEKSANVSIRIFARDAVLDLRQSKTINLGDIYAESEYTNKVISRVFSLKNANLGELLFIDKKLKFANFLDVIVKNNNLYNIDPFKNSTWRWYSQSLAHLPNLISYYDLSSKDKLVLNYLLKSIYLWKKYSLSRAGINNKSLWHDHATALRLRNINISFCYLIKNGIISSDTDDYYFLLDLIKLHIDKLMQDDFYSKHTNHGFDQSLFLYHASLEFENLIPQLDKVIDTAESRLIDEINYAFCEDGGHKENSPAYLNFGIKQCLMALEISESYGRLEKLKHVKNILENATKALTYTVKPDGYLPLVGDTSIYRLVDLFSNYKPNSYSEFKYAVTNGKNGNKPISNKLILPDTGYAYYRSHWEKEGFMDAIHLGFKACFHSNYHRHDDDLSITLYGYGQDWLIDGGIYKYEEKNPHRRYIRSHLSHNILSPNNAIALRDKDNRHEVFLTELSGLDGDDFHVLGKSKMFMDYVNTREIKVLCENSFTVKDKCINISNEKFDATSRLFFPNSIDIEIKNNTIIAKGKNKHLFIEVSTHSDISINLKLNPKEKIVGWLSDSTNVLKQTNLVEITTSENAQQDISIEMKFIFK